MATDWLQLGSTWYFLDADGIMQTGWLKDEGVCYYLYKWGGMANSGWVQVGNTWYYMRGNGAMMTGWLQQGSNWYYLKDSGAMATGWNWVGSNCYYFNASGKMAANTTVGGYKDVYKRQGLMREDCRNIGLLLRRDFLSLTTLKLNYLLCRREPILPGKAERLGWVPGQA